MHILSAAPSYQSFALATGTGLGHIGGTHAEWEIALNGHRASMLTELSSDMGRTDMHTLSAA
eukprot:6222728-Karenia_brevis.AAC.1